MLLSPRVVMAGGAVIVGVATWFAAQSGEVSSLLFLVFLFTAGLVRYLGQVTEDVAFVVSALFSVFLFIVPVALCKTPRSPEQITRFNIGTCVWLLVYLTALLWPGDPAEFAL